MTLARGASPVARNPTGPLRGDPPPDVPRDRWGRPMVVPRSGGPAAPYIRASTLGGVLEDQYALGRWRLGQVVLGMGLRPDLVLAAQACTAGPTDKDRRASVAERAMEAAESNAPATIGTAIHALTDRIDRGETLPRTEVDATLAAYREAVGRFTVHTVETFVACDELRAAGTFDRLVSPRGRMTTPDGTVYGPSDRLVWDLKTSSTADYFGVKFAVQLSVYSRGEPYLTPESGGRPGWPDGIAPSRDHGLILHAPSGGTTADLWWVDLRQGAELAELAVRVHGCRKVRTLVRPADPPDVESSTPVPLDVEDAIIARLGEAVDEEALDRVWRERVDDWSERCTEVARTRMDELLRPPF